MTTTIIATAPGCTMPLFRMTCAPWNPSAKITIVNRDGKTLLHFPGYEHLPFVLSDGERANIEVSSAEIGVTP